MVVQGLEALQLIVLAVHRVDRQRSDCLNSLYAVKLYLFLNTYISPFHPK